MWDAFGVGFMNQGLTPSIWVMTSLGVGVYLGGNLIWATIISMILAGIGFPIVWGVLGGSMPRSGGEYIYNSRIIHPIVGIGESFGNAFVWIMWIYVLAPWMADPGMVMMSQFMNWTWLYNPETEQFFGSLSYTWGSFVIATVANIVAFLFVVFGIKWFARIQKVVMIFGIGGCAVLLGAISYYALKLGQTGFVESWNATAATYGSIDYAGFLAKARRRGRPGHADHVELVRHLRRHGRRLVAVRLQLLHHVHRRRGQASRTRPSSCPTSSRSSSPACSCSGPRSRCTAWSSSTSSRRRSSSTTPAATWAAPTPCRGAPTSSASSAWSRRTRSSCSSRCSRSWRSTCGGSPSATWRSRASSSPGAWTAWAPSGSRTSTRASRAPSRTTSCASCSARS